MPYHVDGEPLVGRTALKVRIHEHALRVAVK